MCLFPITRTNWRTVVYTHTQLHSHHHPIPILNFHQLKSLTYTESSVADPGWLFRIEFFHPRSRIQGLQDPVPHQIISVFLSDFNPKNCFYALGNIIRDVHPAGSPDPDFFSIPDPDTQHWQREEFLNSYLGRTALSLPSTPYGVQKNIRECGTRSVHPHLRNVVVVLVDHVVRAAQVVEVMVVPVLLVIVIII